MNTSQFAISPSFKTLKAVRDELTLHMDSSLPCSLEHINVQVHPNVPPLLDVLVGETLYRKEMEGSTSQAGTLSLHTQLLMILASQGQELADTIC